MPICQLCSLEFKNWIKINGVSKNVKNRKFCVSCSPWGKHNTKNIATGTQDKTEKRCPRCGTVKVGQEFYRRRKNSDFSAYCKICTNLQTTERTQQLKREAVAYKGGKCIFCGYKKCLAALDFHHRDKSQKKFSISQVRVATLEKIKAELDKCDLVCCRCHREKEWQEKYPQEDSNLQLGFRKSAPSSS